MNAGFRFSDHHRFDPAGDPVVLKCEELHLAATRALDAALRDTSTTGTERAYYLTRVKAAERIVRTARKIARLYMGDIRNYPEALRQLINQ